MVKELVAVNYFSIYILRMYKLSPPNLRLKPAHWHAMVCSIYNVITKKSLQTVVSVRIYLLMVLSDWSDGVAEFFITAGPIYSRKGCNSIHRIILIYAFLHFFLHFFYIYL